MGAGHYGNTSCQVRHVLPLKTHHTSLAYQVSITDFANLLIARCIISQGAIESIIL